MTSIAASTDSPSARNTPVPKPTKPTPIPSQLRVPTGRREGDIPGDAAIGVVRVRVIAD